MGPSNTATEVVRIIREPFACDKVRFGIRTGIAAANAMSCTDWHATLPRRITHTSHPGRKPPAHKAAEITSSTRYPALLASSIFFGPQRSVSSPPSGDALENDTNVSPYPTASNSAEPVSKGRYAPEGIVIARVRTLIVRPARY
jgi:hypothetical protein